MGRGHGGTRDGVLREKLVSKLRASNVSQEILTVLPPGQVLSTLLPGAKISTSAP
jgi:hypothetical protein